MKRILEQLGYAKSSHFLSGKALKGVNGYSHVFRRALAKTELRGVYALQAHGNNTREIVPLVYVCEAQNDAQAREIHRQVWNQNIVPFLLVKSPRYLRLYKGFSYNHNATDPNSDTFGYVPIGSDQLFDTVNSVLDLVISVDDIEHGRIWQQWGKQIEPDQRVDRILLWELEKLGSWLTSHDVDIQTAHALVGKFVYLRYLLLQRHIVHKSGGVHVSNCLIFILLPCNRFKVVRVWYLRASRLCSW